LIAGSTEGEGLGYFTYRGRSWGVPDCNDLNFASMHPWHPAAFDADLQRLMVWHQLLDG